MNHEREKLGCVVLAAGRSCRFGSNKLLSSLGGRSLILRALETVPPGVFDTVMVVTRFPEILRLAEDFHFAAVLNDRPELGLSRSVQLGLTGLRDCAGVCFLVSDQPLLRQESVASLAELWRVKPDRIAALGHGGVRGNPCIFPSRLFPELMALTGDHGGASVIRRHEEELMLLEVPSRELADADTPEGLAEIGTWE